MKKVEILKRIAQILAVMSVLFLCWSTAFFITPWFFKWIGESNLNDYLRQVINSFVGFFLFGLIMFSISRITRIREKQNYFFVPMIEAMKKMAQGNFNIDLSYYKKFSETRNHPFHTIVESINHMAKELGEMEQMRQEFISNVSHEIQSPLTSINGFAQALKNDQLSKEERDDYLQIIETESMRLSKLSENLLKLTSLESEHHPFKPRTYRLDQQLRRIILSSEPQWANKNIDMDVSLGKIFINADEDLMDQVWLNLIYNSIKFTPDHGQICIQTVSNDAGSVSIKIKDTGIGMTQEAQMHIFERFYKADKSRNRSFGGSGLGLSIVKKIIELHKGEIQVISAPNEGTEITVTLFKN